MPSKQGNRQNLAGNKWRWEIEKESFISKTQKFFR